MESGTQQFIEQKWIYERLQQSKLLGYSHMEESNTYWRQFG